MHIITLAMQESTSKEKILKKIRNALIMESPEVYPNVDFTSNIYEYSDDSTDVMFAKRFTEVSGKFIFCETIGSFTENLKLLLVENKWKVFGCFDETIKAILNESEIPFQDQTDKLTEINAGITGCEFLVARTGSVMISSAQPSGRRLIVYPEVHIVLAQMSQLVRDMKDALNRMKEKYPNGLPSLISAITGPSRTADIEKTLILGAHGPKEVYVFLIED